MEIVDEGMITTGDDWLRCLAGRMKCRPLACLDFRFFFFRQKEARDQHLRGRGTANLSIVGDLA